MPRPYPGNWRPEPFSANWGKRTVRLTGAPLMARRFSTAGLITGMLLLAASDAFAQNSIRGRVRDENNRPVSFVQVQISPEDRRVVADQNGEFIIGSLRTGEYEIRLRRIGYSPTQVTVQVPNDGAWIPITMTSLPRVLDSVRIRERSSGLRYTGIVVDDFDQPVADAEVIAAGASDLGVRTNSEGQFRLVKSLRNTLALRVRKFGYAPYFGTLTIRAEREDTIRMKRHATDLPEAYIREQSGFGRDSFAFIELDSRTRWRLSSGGMASREDLDAHAELDLCQALMRTPLGGKMKLTERSCGMVQCFIIDGLLPLIRPLNSFMAAEVEAFEYHQKDWTGSLASRRGDHMECRSGRDGGGMVIWLRAEGTKTGRIR